MDRPDPDLTLRRRPIWTGLGALLVMSGSVGLAVFYASNPPALPTDERIANASTPVDQTIYIGVARGVDGRTLQLSGVKVHATGEAEVTVVPLLCRGGRVDVTTAPESYCAAVIDPEGESFGPADSIMLRVTGGQPGHASIDPVRLVFRQGLQWGTLPIGAGATVDVLAR